MLSFTMAVLGAFLMGLVVASGVHQRLRLRRRLWRARPLVDDDAVRTIIERGVLMMDEDEPLDYDDIEEQERRFFESWDEPEEW